jgi:hypothetical protein
MWSVPNDNAAKGRGIKFVQAIRLGSFEHWMKTPPVARSAPSRYGVRPKFELPFLCQNLTVRPKPADRAKP